jgi:hypothetical protein
MLSHEEAGDLLAPYALDAVDGEERAELEAHLAGCPRCRAELDGLREVAAAIGNGVEPLPEGLWSSIVSRLPEHPEVEEEHPPMPRLVAGTPSTFRPRARRGGGRRGRRAGHADNRVSSLQSAAPPSVSAYLMAPGHQLVDLDSATHAQLAQFVVLPDGRGYLVSSKLPALGATQTYQLWGIVGSQPVSLGLLGDSPRQAAFTMAGSTRPSRLAITAEPSGGSVVPTGPILATGTV